MDTNKKMKIRSQKNAPYVVLNGEVIHTSQGNESTIDNPSVLCRCGQSKNKPFCDKSHIKAGFRSHKLEGRQPDKVDRYVGKKITILDNRGVCSHRGYCTDNLPQVFRQKEEPWIDPEAADVQEIIRVIKMCPSGALAYEIDNEQYTDWNEEEKITLVKNGPAEVKGNIAFFDEEKNTPQTPDHYTLCRCGGSKNKPFCDGTHWTNGFTDENESDDSSKKNNLKHMNHIHKMASSGKSINEPMGTLLPTPSWDLISFSGAQLSRLPVNEDETVELKTIIGKNAKHPLEIALPVTVTHMSFGALSKEAKVSLAKGSAKAKTAIGSGEGGVLQESRKEAYKYIFEYVQNQYSVNDENLQQSDAIEIKIGQAVKPGIGGHFPAEKITKKISEIRNRPFGNDIVTPARYADIYDARSLSEKIDYLRKTSGGKPIGVKIAAGHIEEDLEIILQARPDFITIDGKGGATGSVSKFIKDASSVPTLLALSRAKSYFIEHGIKDISLIITGGLRVSSDIAKAIAMGADAVALGTAALMAIGCQQYRLCNTGLCPTGVATHDPLLSSRIDIDFSAEHLFNFLEVTKKELETYTRMCGYHQIHDLSLSDLTTHDYNLSLMTGIKF